MIELYQDLIAIAKIYMGIAAEEYVKRRCVVSFGLNDPTAIKKEHLDRLAEAIGITAEVYIGLAKVKQFREEVLKLKDKY
jgi:hypothetical protein